MVASVNIKLYRRKVVGTVKNRPQIFSKLRKEFYAFKIPIFFSRKLIFLENFDNLIYSYLLKLPILVDHKYTRYRSTVSTILFPILINKF